GPCSAVTPGCPPPHLHPLDGPPRSILRRDHHSRQRGTPPESGTPGTSPFPSRLRPSAAAQHGTPERPPPSSSPAPPAGRTPGTPRGGPPPNAAQKAHAPPPRLPALPSAKLAPAD